MSENLFPIGQNANSIGHHANLVMKMMKSLNVKNLSNPCLRLPTRDSNFATGLQLMKYHLSGLSLFRDYGLHRNCGLAAVGFG
jgi:hypothetical protein